MRWMGWLSIAGVIALGAASVGCDSDETGTGGAGNGGSAGAGVGGGGTGGVAPAGEIAGPVTRYDYVFDTEALTADTVVTVDVQSPGGDCVALESAIEVGAVTWNGEPAVSATAADGVLQACGAAVFPGELAVGASAVVPKKKYYGLDVGYSRKKDMAGGDFSYLLSWVEGCDYFGPCDDDPGTVAEMHFEVKHPAGLPVLCAGARTEGETSTRCDIEGTLAPTYSAVAWASDPLWEKKSFANINGVEWVFYEVPGGKLASSLDPAMMSQFFGWMVARFGPFPYGKELRFAGGPTAWLGFEHPANILLREKLDALQTDYVDTMSHVTMHEITHQWAGDRTTIASAGDFVWKEAMAEYLPYVFEDETLGGEVAAATRAYWDGISLQAKHFPRPTDEPLPHVSQFYGDVYGPGPMVLFLQLEALIGRAAVLDGIEAFLGPAGGRSVAELAAALSKAAGVDLGPYFDAWVFGAGVPEWPTLKVETQSVGGFEEVTVTQVNPSGKLYGCVVEVEVQGATSSVLAKIDFGVAPTSASASAVVTLNEPVVATVLDPQHKLIARNAAVPLKAPTPRPVWIF
ncbi:MAG: M1 family aminopeptidase [Polyangiaceae bacterium]